MKYWISLLLIVMTGVLSCDDSYFFRKPVLISPIEDEVVPHVFFIWHPCDSLYRLQMAKDWQFEEVIIDVENLTDTTYTPSGEIEDGKYYWKVFSKEHTMDEWVRESEPESFVVSGS